MAVMGRGADCFQVFIMPDSIFSCRQFSNAPAALDFYGLADLILFRVTLKSLCGAL